MSVGIIPFDGPWRPEEQIDVADNGKGKMMSQHFGRLAVLAAAGGLLLASAGCTNWTDRTQWPQEHKFQGQIVRRHHEYLTGDYDTDMVKAGQTPAEYCNYYAYVDGGKTIRHGRAAWWFPNGKIKAECIYVHGKKTDRSMYYPTGVLAERVKTSDDGERGEFFDKAGKLFGTQQYDNRTKKRTYVLRGKPVPQDDFMFEYARVVLGVKRVTP